MSDQRFDSPLNNISVASPCPADWDQMYGDDRKRFCGDCKLNVYNLSGMTRNEAEALVTNHEGRLCIRYFKRADGSIITADCPVGWAKVKQRTKLYATAVASLLMALFTGLLFVQLFKRQTATVGVLRVPFTTPTPPPPPEMPLMGAIAPMPPKNTNKKTEVMGEMEVPNTNQSTDAPKSKFQKGKRKVMTQISLDDI